MGDNTNILFHELLEEANKKSINSDRLDTLITLLLDGAELDYKGKALRVGNDEAIMAFVKAIYSKAYFDTLARLQKEKEEEKNDGK